MGNCFTLLDFFVIEQKAIVVAGAQHFNKSHQFIKEECTAILRVMALIDRHLHFDLQLKTFFCKVKKGRTVNFFTLQDFFIIAPDAEILVGKQQNVNKTNQLIWNVCYAGDDSN